MDFSEKIDNFSDYLLAAVPPKFGRSLAVLLLIAIIFGQIGIGLLIAAVLYGTGFYIQKKRKTTT